MAAPEGGWITATRCGCSGMGVCVEAEIAFLRQLALEGFQRQMELPFAAVLREFDHKLIAAAERIR
ncbi:MAG: hypothetical protein ACLSHC_04105 [Bilophila wadsworthia]